MKSSAIRKSEWSAVEDASTTGKKLPLLFLCHRIPFPPRKGDKIRAFHLLRYLSRHFSIYLASFVDDEEDWAEVSEVEKYCHATFFRPLRPWLARARSLRGFISGEALSLPYYSDIKLRRWVEKTCASQSIRHTLVYSSTMAQFLPVVGHAFQRKIIDFVDVDSDKWKQYADLKPWPLSWLYRREARCLLRSERQLAEYFDTSLFVSSSEAALFQRLGPEIAHKVSFFNNGVDCNYFCPIPKEESETSSHPTGEAQALVFTGAMDYWPNVDAVTWFAREVLPILQRSFPGLEFHIVGGNPSTAVQRLSRLPGVTVTGRVADVRPYLANAIAAVAPMRVARGIQNKVLEAMAMGLPVLVSTMGLDGIEAQPGEHVLLADSAEDYCRVVTEIIEGGHAGLGARARQRVKETFEWEKNLSEVVDLLNQTTTTSTPLAASSHE